jgi:NAD(P)-dependent dehydrogenase (short-subunit alcohol dehydrogenase family)
MLRREARMKEDSGMRLAIVTGTSAGLGLAIVRALLDAGWEVLGIARRPAPLDQPGYRHVRFDLGDVSAVEAFAAALADDDGIQRASRLGLVNNAGRLGTVRPLTRLSGHDLVHGHAVNVVAPLLLSGAMAGIAGERPLRIVDVSSGAARTARAGRAVYSSTKAALRLGAMALAAESVAGVAGPARDLAVVSYEPGMVDTPMQEENRAASPEDFPDVATFRRLHAEGQLVPPERVSRDVAALLDRDDLPPFSERAFAAPG